MNVDRSWRQVETISILDNDAGIRGQAFEQVAGAVNNLLIGQNLHLPEFLLDQTRESLFRAILASSDQDMDPSSPSFPSEIQVAVHLADQERLSESAAPVTDRWGFFLVQKRSDRSGARRLFLDLFYYRE